MAPLTGGAPQALAGASTIAGKRAYIFSQMNYELVALIGMMVAAVAIGVKQRFWFRPADPRRDDQRVFSAAAGGMLFLVSGVVGWDLRHSHGWFEGTRWVGGPIWWEVGVGTAFLLLAGFWARRLPAFARKPRGASYGETSP
jgi:hypothetical protein